MNHRWGILALVVLAQTGGSLLSLGLPTLFVFLQKDFQLSRAEVGLFLSAMEAGTVASFVLGGWAADALGIRRVLPFGQALMGILGLAFAQAATFHQGLVVLVFAGLALGLANPALSMAILLWFPARGRGTAMGIKHTGVPLAGMLSAALLPGLALAVGWRVAIVAVSSATLSTAVLALLLYRDPSGLRPAGSPRLPSRRQIIALVRQRELLLVNTFAVVLFADQFIIVGYLILYLRDHLAVPVVVGGLILALAQAGAFCGRILWGLFSDLVLQGRRVPAMGLAGAIAALLLTALALLPRGTPLWLLASLAFGIGLSAIGWHGLRHALVLEAAPRTIAGMTFGVSQTVAEAGPILGPPLFGAMTDLLGYRPAWLAMAVATGLVSLALVRSVNERRARAGLRLAVNEAVSAPLRAQVEDERL